MLHVEHIPCVITKCGQYQWAIPSFSQWLLRPYWRETLPEIYYSYLQTWSSKFCYCMLLSLYSILSLSFLPLYFLQVGLLIAILPWVTHLLATWKPSLKLLDCGRTIQNDVDIDTYSKPELISINWHNSVLHAFSVPRWQNVRSHRLIDSSSIIAHPVNFDEPFRQTAGDIAKMWCQKLAKKRPTGDVGDYLYLKNGSLKFEVDPHQFNMRLHHFSI